MSVRFDPGELEWHQAQADTKGVGLTWLVRQYLPEDLSPADVQPSPTSPELLLIYFAAQREAMDPG